MKKYLIFAFVIIFYSCSGDSNESNSAEKEQRSGSAASVNTNEPQNNLVSLPDGEYYFSGAIAHIYPFHMRFEIADGEITGAYYYHSQKKEISLNGQIIQGKLELDEKYKDKITGHFVSDVLTADSISGIWKSPKGKTFDFVLSSSDEDEYLFHMNKQKQEWTTEEFLAFAGKFEPTDLPFKYDPVDEDDQHEISVEDVDKFILKDYNPEKDFEYSFFYGKKYETENYIALVYTENYFPGAFGISNANMVLKTFTKNGEPIDENYLGCECYDNNYYDYYSTSEDFEFTLDKVIITGSSHSSSHEWAEEEGMPVFDETKEINRIVKITSDGKIGN